MDSKAILALDSAGVSALTGSIVARLHGVLLKALPRPRGTDIQAMVAHAKILAITPESLVTGELARLFIEAIIIDGDSPTAPDLAALIKLSSDAHRQGLLLALDFAKALAAGLPSATPIRTLAHMHKEGVLPFVVFWSAFTESIDGEKTASFVKLLQNGLCVSSTPVTTSPDTASITDIFWSLVDACDVSSLSLASRAQAKKAVENVMAAMMPSEAVEKYVYARRTLTTLAQLTRGQSKDQHSDLYYEVYKNLCEQILTNLMSSEEPTQLIFLPIDIRDEFSTIGEALCGLISTLSLQTSLAIAKTAIDAASFSWKGVLFVIRGLLSFRDYAAEVTKLVDSRLAAALESNDLKSLAITVCLTRQLSLFQISEFPGHEQWFHSHFIDEVSVVNCKCITNQY